MQYIFRGIIIHVVLFSEHEQNFDLMVWRTYLLLVSQGEWSTSPSDGLIACQVGQNHDPPLLIPVGEIIVTCTHVVVRPYLRNGSEAEVKVRPRII